MKKTHKFVIEMPKTVKEVAKLDKKNGDTFHVNSEMNRSELTYKY